MITSLSFFVLSGIILVYMLLGKKREMATGRSMVSFGSYELDTRLHSQYERIARRLRSIDSVYLKNMMHRIAAFFEKTSLKIVAKFMNKFSKVTDLVTGKDLPKNKGSVSFFLKHIEKGQKRLQ